MSDFRSEAEKFVTEFIDYVNKYDIKDSFNKQRNKMERSPGIENLIKQANRVFPERIGQDGNNLLSNKQVDEAILASPNVVDTRKMFSRKVAANGSARGLLEAVLAGEPGAVEMSREFIRAENGEKDFGQED